MTWAWLGFAGTALVMVAYAPQLRHMVGAKCTAGVSVGAYALWALAAAALLTYAVAVGDTVFMVLQGYQLAVTGVIFAVAVRHKGRLCAMHCGEEPADHAHA